MSIEQIVDVPESGNLFIQLPDDLKKKKQVKVIIEDVDEDREAKIALLRQAATDPLFLADMEEVNKDFEDDIANKDTETG